MTAMFLFVAVATAVQTHPCDMTTPTLFREPAAQLANLKISFCAAAIDTENNPITDPIGFSMQVNGGPDVDLGILTPLTGPNGEGYRYYQTQHPALAAGVITIKVYAAVYGSSAPSVPVTLTLLGSPKPPKGVQISR